MGFWQDLFGGNKDKEPEGSVGTVYQGAGGPGGMTGGEAFQSGIITPEERREQLLKQYLADNLITAEHYRLALNDPDELTENGDEGGMGESVTIKDKTQSSPGN
jgi:hypothetical protein